MAFGNALAFPFHRSKLAAAVEWTPANLFLDGEAGGWYDPTYQAEGDSYPLWQTIAAEDEADAVGDPIGLYLSNPRANEEDFSQATSAARPTLGRVPRGVGIVNALRGSEEIGDTQYGWAASVNTLVTPHTNEITDPYGGNNASRSVIGAFATQTRIAARYSVSLPPGDRNSSIWVYVPSGQPGFTTDGWYFGVDYQDVEHSADASPKPFDQWVRVDVNSTLAAARSFIDFNVSFNSAMNNVPLGTVVYLFGAQSSAGHGVKPYQRVGAAYDITQEGVPSVQMPYYDGGDYLSLGNPALSDGCSFFADASQKWAVGGVFNSVAAGSLILFAKASATSASRTLQVYRNAAGGLSLIVRGTDTSSGIPLAFGLFHSWLLVWDGSVLQLYIDNHAPVAINVGTAVEETTEVPLIGARTASSPAGYFNGFNDLLLMRSGPMSPAEISRWRAYVNDKYGVA